MIWGALFFSLLFHVLLLLNLPVSPKNSPPNISVVISANIMVEQTNSSSLQETVVSEPEPEPVPNNVVIPLPVETIVEKKVEKKKHDKVIKEEEIEQVVQGLTRKEAEKEAEKEVEKEVKKTAKELKLEKKIQPKEIAEKQTEQNLQHKILEKNIEVNEVLEKNSQFAKLTTSESISTTDLQSIEQLKITYRDILLKHIDFYKIYPKIAQRRRIEGKVRVDLKLSSRVDISGLHLQYGTRILKSATKKAIQRALPMPEIPEEISLPLQISFFMEYRLQ